MPRAIWKGSISFGLVHVPVSLYPAENSRELHLSMLDSRDFAPVGYKRINKTTGDEVPFDKIVKGFEYAKGEFVTLTEEDLKRANVEATQTVEIVDFVDASQIPLTYYDKPYYLEPQRRGEKAYALLRETLRRTGKVGIAKVVLHTREHLAALIPQGDVLVLDLLRYQDELRQADELKIPRGDQKALGLTDKELEMAQTLVQSMVEPWRPEKYHDEYHDDLMRMVDERVKAGETHLLQTEAPQAPRQKAEVIDLMTQLRRSIEQRAQGAAPEPPAAEPKGRATRARKNGNHKAKKRA